MNDQAALQRLHTQRKQFERVMIGRNGEDSERNQTSRETTMVITVEPIPGTTQPGITAEVCVVKMSRYGGTVIERVIAKTPGPQATFRKAVSSLFDPMNTAIAKERAYQRVTR